MKAKLTILFLLSLLFTSCGILFPATGPEVISIQVLNEQQEPIKTIIVRELYTFPENVIKVENSLNGTVILPLEMSNKRIYIGSYNYEGIIINATDTVVILKNPNNL